MNREALIGFLFGFLVGVCCIMALLWIVATSGA